jgi:transposase, IS5 family
MEESLYKTTIIRQFEGLSLERIPDETTPLNFRRLLDNNHLVEAFWKSLTTVWGIGGG